MTSESVDLFDVADLSPRGQIPDLHILDHPSAKRGHDQLLCEVNSATWRRRIVSQLSRQAREGRTVAANGSHNIGKPLRQSKNPAKRVSPTYTWMPAE